jgi:hypothetical protein
MKRIAIRNKRSLKSKNPRVFDALIDGEEVYLEVLTSKTDKERIPISDVLEQIRIATTDQQSTVTQSQSTTAK